ncbi:MAG: putative selenate reductase molybdopterin-binding subunit [Halobacteriales archaeon]|jgi:putative selenate reductase molybdopterin-binding subunit
MSRPNDPEERSVEAETAESDEPPADRESVSDLEAEHPIEYDEASNNRKSKTERLVISHREEKDDARKIVTGDAKYTADYSVNFQDLAEAKILRSEIAHGHVKSIDTTKAETLDGVYAVLTPWSDEIPDRKYTSAGQSYPEPSPRDMHVLRETVRYVGDPIAAVAAEDAQTASRAVRLLEVEYEELDAVFDPEAAMALDAPQIHDRDEIENGQPGHDYERNVESHVEGEIGDVESAIEAAKARDDALVVETEWETPYQSHCVPEPHTTIAHRDENHRYHLITSTQVPFHTRRQLAELFEVPIRDIRVSKPRIGAGFGAKQSMMTEPIALALTRAVDRPVKVQTTRSEQFYAMRFRRPMKLSVRSAVSPEGDLEALELSVVSNSGAYGPHGMTVTGNVGTKPLPLYPRVPNIRFEMDAVHTNLPVGGAQRGYGAPQGHMAIEGHMDEVARALDMDPIEFRSQNHVREGDLDRAAAINSAEGHLRRIRSCGIPDCIERGKAAIGWGEVEQPSEDYRHRACGMALAAQGSGVAADELGAARLKMNEDGSFVLQSGAVDIGPGADTVMAQIAAEVLTVDPEDVVVQDTDTDITPHEYGAYASSTTYLTGQAVKKAAENTLDELLSVASRMFGDPVADLRVEAATVVSEPSGETVTFEDVGYESIYGDEERVQIMGQASHSTDESPPPYGAQFVDVTVDERTGEFEVNNLAFAADCGVAINPSLAEGQVEGAVHMGYEYAVSGGLEFDEDGRPETLTFRDYGMPTTADQPPIESILVETHEPTGPFGAKSIGELPTNGVPPALSNAIRRAVGARVSDLPITPEKVRAAMESAPEKRAAPSEGVGDE